MWTLADDETELGVAVLTIRRFGDPVLRTRAQEIEKITELHLRLAEDMLETMRAAPGVGLAANQVGVLERIFVWGAEGESGALINPVITERSEETSVDEEGCLSIPGLQYPVERSQTVVVEALDQTGEAITIEAEEYLARIFQHEIDHLDGVLFFERLPDDLRRKAMAEIRDQALGLTSMDRGRNEEAL